MSDLLSILYFFVHLYQMDVLRRLLCCRSAVTMHMGIDGKSKLPKLIIDQSTVKEEDGWELCIRLRYSSGRNRIIRESGWVLTCLKFVQVESH
jgi:hypothetical protein